MVEASLLDIKQQIREVENSLSILLGDVPDAIDRGKLEGQDFPQELAVGVPLQLLSRRPDVKSAELSLAQAFYSTEWHGGLDQLCRKHDYQSRKTIVVCCRLADATFIQ